jgi:hypothetical protein
MLKLVSAAILGLYAATASADLREVDAELVLMVDVSNSASPRELLIQRRGYAEALSSQDVVDAVRNGGIGAIAVTLIEFGGPLLHREILPWTIFDGPAAAHQAETRLKANFGASMDELHNTPIHLRQTSISGALQQGRKSLDANAFAGLRRIIDVSGDGPNNDGIGVVEARDAVLAEGIIVNGLALMVRTPDAEIDPENENLDGYFAECVIGGPGAFVLPVAAWHDFAFAVRRKLLIEMSANPEERFWVEGTLGAGPQGVDCLLGERMRRERESGR